jgi:hypothetical protein
MKELIGYVYSDFAADLDKRMFFTNYVFTVGDCAMSWRTTLQPVIIQSTTKAEYMAIAKACKEFVWLKVSILSFVVMILTLAYIFDSRSAICLTEDQMFHERSKHIDVKYYYVRDIVVQGKLQVCKSCTHDNPVDMMTKSVHVAKFEHCSSLVGITV